MSKTKSEKVVTCTGRILFIGNLFEKNDKGLYKASLLFDKNQEGVKKLQKIMRDTALEKFDEKIVKSKKFRWGLKGHDEEAIEQYEFFTEDTMILDANSKHDVEVKGSQKGPDGKLETLIEGDIKAGDHCRFIVTPFAWEHDDDGVSRGCKFFLSAVQKIKDGEALYSRVPSDDIFGEAEFDITPEESTDPEGEVNEAEEGDDW